MAEFTGNSEDSEDSSIPISQFYAARKQLVRTKASLKEISGDTPVTSHRENQDNDKDNTVENVEISQTSNHTKSHSKLKKGKVQSMKGKESQEPPVTPQREESTDEIENVAGKSSTATRGQQRSRSKKNKENILVAAAAIRRLRAKRKKIEERELRDTGRDTIYVNTRDKLEDNRNRITSPSQVQDDDEITLEVAQEVLTVTPRKRNYQRKQPSVVWKHAEKRKKSNIELVQCNYCEKNWEVAHLSGSTSNLLKHLRVQHYSQFTAQDRADMPQNGRSSGNRGQPPRTLNRREVDGQPMPRSHRLCQEMDRKIAKFFYIFNLF